jgi:hypothetical protein
MHRLVPPFIFGMALFVMTSGPEIRTDLSLSPLLFPETAPAIVPVGNQSKMILTDRVEKEDRVLYGTDSDPAFSQAEQEREEKIKEEKSWRMLENMNIYQNNGKKVPPRRSDDKKQ